MRGACWSGQFVDTASAVLGLSLSKQHPNQTLHHAPVDVASSGKQSRLGKGGRVIWAVKAGARGPGQGTLLHATRRTEAQHFIEGA